MADGTLRLVYAGALSPIYELDVVLDAVARLAAAAAGACRSASTSTAATSPRCRFGTWRPSSGSRDRVAFHGRIPIEEVPAAIAAADVGLAPTRRSDFTDFSLSTKAFEYAAMGRPVVASRLPMVERTFGDDVVTYEPGRRRRPRRGAAPPRRRTGGPRGPRRPRAGPRPRPGLGARVGPLPGARRPARDRAATSGRAAARRSPGRAWQAARRPGSARISRGFGRSRSASSCSTTPRSRASVAATSGSTSSSSCPGS